MLRSAALTALAAAAALAPAALAQDPAPSPIVSHPVAPGTAFQASDRAEVTGTRVSLRVRCVAGDRPCEGVVRLRTLRPVRSAAGAPPRIVTIAEGSYGTIAAGASRVVALPVRRAARRHLARTRSTVATVRFTGRDGAVQVTTLSRRVTVVDAAIPRRG
jgi:hypothetical protein